MRNTARQETASTRMPPTNGPRIVVAADAPAHTPNARPCSSPEKLAVMIASDPGTSTAPNAPCSTRNAISMMMFGASPHSTDVAPNPTSPMANILRRPKKSFSAPARISNADRDRR